MKVKLADSELAVLVSHYRRPRLPMQNMKIGRYVVTYPMTFKAEDDLGIPREWGKVAEHAYCEIEGRGECSGTIAVGDVLHLKVVTRGWGVLAKYAKVLGEGWEFSDDGVAFVEEWVRGGE